MRSYTPRGEGLTAREFYDKQSSALKLERTSFEDHWTDLAHFVKPRRTRAFTTDKNKGDRRNKHIIDNTASYAHRTLQSGMHAGITSPARPWFQLTTPDPDMAERPNVKAWLYLVTQRMRTVFAKTNLYNALPIVYGDMGLFGTGCMGVFESQRELFRCEPYALMSYWLGVDSNGRVNQFVRETSMTVFQMIEAFGVKPGSRDIDRSKFSQQVLNMWDKGDDQLTVDVCSYIGPNREANPNKGHAKYFPFVSYWYEKGENQGKDGKALRESGYREFPIMAPRWDVTDQDIYGTDCPGMQALGGAKALQILQKRKAQGVEKLINPPMQAPPELATKTVSVLPGAVTYVSQREAHGGIRPLYEIRPDLSAMIESIQDERGLIREAFFADLFLMLNNDVRLQPPTAREIEERHEEKVFALGPVLERTQDELLKPLIDRVFAMMDRAGMIPPAPDEIQGVDIPIEYTSVLAGAQKSVGISMTDRFVQSVAFVAESFPEARHKLDPMQIVDAYADMTGVDPRVIRSDDDAKASLQAEQKAMADQAAAEQAKNLGAAGKDLAAAPMDGDTALSRLATAAGGAEAAA